jgi:hypothetical protein
MMKLKTEDSAGPRPRGTPCGCGDDGLVEAREGRAFHTGGRQAIRRGAAVAGGSSSLVVEDGWIPMASTIGILLKNERGRVVVDDVDRLSPNASLVQIGDVMLAVDGLTVLGKLLSEVRPMLAGPVGKAIRVTLLRRDRGQMIVTLVRHEVNHTSMQHAFDADVMAKAETQHDLVHLPQMVGVPQHKLITWDYGLARQVALSVNKDALELPEGYLDVTVVNVENLPVCYDIGWSLTSIGTATATPFVEGAVATCRLRTSSQASKLSVAINQTLRLPIIDTSPLCICVKNDDLSVGGNVIGEVKFPMQQIANDGFRTQARFRITVAACVGERVPTLQHLEEGDEVTGLQGRPSSVQLELAYHGRPFSTLQVQGSSIQITKPNTKQRLLPRPPSTSTRRLPPLTLPPRPHTLFRTRCWRLGRWRSGRRTSCVGWSVSGRC